MLESYEHAKARGAKIYAEVIGYGMSGDAYHITAPAESGDGAFRAMQAAIKRAGIEPRDIDYINAHGTSTPLGDEIELRTVQRLLGEGTNSLSMSSTKSAVGHLLGGRRRGRGRCSRCWRCATRSWPPTINLDNPPDFARIDLVPHEARKRDVEFVLSNSFGFGGTNACLILTHAH